MRIAVGRLAIRGASAPIEADVLRASLRRELGAALTARRPAGREAAAELVADAARAAVSGGRR